MLCELGIHDGLMISCHPFTANRALFSGLTAIISVWCVGEMFQRGFSLRVDFFVKEKKKE